MLLLPTRDGEEDAGVGGTTGFAIRSIVLDLLRLFMSFTLPSTATPGASVSVVVTAMLVATPIAPALPVPVPIIPTPPPHHLPLQCQHLNLDPCFRSFHFTQITANTKRRRLATRRSFPTTRF